MCLTICRNETQNINKDKSYNGLHTIMSGYMKNIRSVFPVITTSFYFICSNEVYAYTAASKQTEWYSGQCDRAITSSQLFIFYISLPLCIKPN